ncbi:16S rRNA (adenine(1518)-N(6)/adenine(1519)-N(6))-dimethyltransferase RsmA [candidate division NPL-UPA2 bacterium Unc8]|uniref:Ribosomal RNA small subunit methyltransferase A n=1 Tax=candidate division NPL-UPA2 bacterium Unc8 TaxID=1980939 RepID=A0A399G0A2_UNCN2|nr:Ribosomal RNA small subunit methyltransferase A [Bacillota bacterium]MBT9137639.1 Ribosomal RNA small subunit methyltransferase A [Bacillota bacterium]MBT9146492.1 Ribosomal RNA small subunit methyltransferase A [Bacillota bacterium]RII01129.1 MAG: 16S rRNA (adenine(1518)-N(6)/adenine(1519)-N(6))-dimethyltransferase RsmA [candidate division NPL-UPA2 bacterium Unc8]
MIEDERKLLKRYGIRPRKKLGQNFLIDNRAFEKILETSELTKNDLVIEIGAGTGSLTERIAPLAAKVIAIEIDERLSPLLAERLAQFDNIRIVRGDILKIGLKGLLELPGVKPSTFSAVKVVANLPYYIITPIIINLLQQKPAPNLLVILVQKELAERITAHPGTKSYGAFSIACQYYCIAELICKVEKKAFFPQPQVDSALLKLVVMPHPLVKTRDKDFFFSIVRASFSKRRKTIENALLYHLNWRREQLRERLTKVRIDFRRRPETLSATEFARLADILQES